MRMAEKIFVVFFVMGFVLKLLHLEGAGLLIGLSITLLALLYFFLGLLLFNAISFRQVFKGNAFKGISAIRILGSIGVGIILALSILGVMFSILHLEGAGFMLTFGLVSTLIVSLILIFKYLTQGSDSFYKNMIMRGGITFLVSLLTYLFLVF